jgi:amino acid permease
MLSIPSNSILTPYYGYIIILLMLTAIILTLSSLGETNKVRDFINEYIGYIITIIATIYVILKLPKDKSNDVNKNSSKDEEIEILKKYEKIDNEKIDDPYNKNNWD